MAVADDLHFDMAGVADQAFDIDAVAAEGGFGLRLAARIGLFQFCGIVDNAHAAPAAAGDGLDHDRAAGAERREERFGLVEAGRTAGAIDNGNAAFFCQRLGLRLVAEQVQRLRRRADEDDPLFCATPRQRGVFAEKAVAGMQRIAPARFRSRDDRLDVEIGPRAPPRDFQALIRAADMQRQRVVGRIDRDRGKAGLAGGTRDPNGDLAAVGDQ